MAAVKTFYHALVVIYQQWVNYIMVTTIMHINNTEPEVIAFVGQFRGVQFVTLWAQWGKMFRQNDVRLSFSAAYRLFCVVYFLWLDYQIIYKILDLFVVRLDIFIMYSRCLGLQFVSFHNTMMQQAFFWIALRADIAEMMGDMQMCAKLRRWSDFVFKYGAVPLTTLVCVNFWVLYAILDWPLAETYFIRDYMPAMLNHGMHSVVFFLNVGELVLTPRQFPLQKGIFRVTLLVLTYSVWTYITKMISGRWPYVFLKDLSSMQHLCYVIANVALAILSYTAAGAFNKRLWNQQEKQIYQKRKQ